MPRATGSSRKRCTAPRSATAADASLRRLRRFRWFRWVRWLSRRRTRASVRRAVGIKVLFVVKEIEGAEPIGALYVAGCLREAGHDVKFVGTRGNDVLDAVRRVRPNVVAYGATTG